MTKMLEGWRYYDECLKIPYPWYTQPCLEWLNTLDLKGKRIFEYGVGDSTEWYRQMGAITKGVDNDVFWASRFNAYYQTEERQYVNSIYLSGYYDIIVIDGEFRDSCTKVALSHLKPNGYLIIDNFHQPSVQEHWPLTDVLITGMDVTIHKQEGHADWQSAVIKCQ